MADRGFPSAIETQLDAETASLAIAVYLDWPGGAVRLWSGSGDKSWDGHTWTGAGELGAIDKIADSVDKSDVGVELTLNYLDDDLRNEVVTNDPVGRDASIFMWAFTTATGAVADDYEIFTGFIDRCEILDSGSTGQLMIRLASELARLNRPRFFLLSHAHQQYLFSGDLGMEFAARMGEPILWGRKPVPVYVPGTQLTPPSNLPYPGYGDQFLFPLPGQ